MSDIVSQMMEFFGMVEIPTDFATFMYYFLGMCFGIRFVEFCVYTCFGFVERINGARR